MLPSPRPLAKAAALALPASAWTRAAERAGQLNVVVLGTSVSAGCNVCDGRGYFSTVLNASLNAHCAGKSEKFCSARAGWAGQLESNLAVLLRGTRLTPRVVVHAKNAVGAPYFAKCARGRVPADTDVVLIDVATNMWNGPQAVGLVLRAVHAAAPSAAIAFVAWLTQVVAMACHDDAPRPNMISVLVMITHHYVRFGQADFHGSYTPVHGPSASALLAAHDTKRPDALIQGRRCALLDIELGYLSRPPRGGTINGALDIRCSGCACQHSNISVTATTAWRAMYRSHSPCYIHITHTAGAYSAAELAAATRNRVLVNTLSVQVGDAASSLHDFAHLWIHGAKYRGASLAALDELRCERERYQRACEKDYAALRDAYHAIPLLCKHAFNVTARSAATAGRLNGSLPHSVPLSNPSGADRGRDAK